MIKENELRVGNYVLLKGTPDKIKGVFNELDESTLSKDEDIQIGYRYCIQGSNLLDYSVNDINPIPLTEEILLKAGFKKHKSLMLTSYSRSISWNDYEADYKAISLNLEPGNQYVYIRDGVKSNQRHKDAIICIFNGDKHGKLHLHWLQNTWKQLTGEELEIKL